MAQPGTARWCAPRSVSLAEELRAWADPVAGMPLQFAALVVATTVAAVPVAGSAARDLRLEITAPDATSDNAMYLFVVAKPNGGPRATANGHATGFVTPMGFRFGALEPLQAQAGQALQRASQYRPEPFKGGVLLAILTVGLLLAIAFLLAISL